MLTCRRRVDAGFQDSPGDWTWKSKSVLEYTRSKLQGAKSVALVRQKSDLQARKQEVKSLQVPLRVGSHRADNSGMLLLELWSIADEGKVASRAFISGS